jgi:phosphatidylglycerophosphate synthase
MAFRDITVAYSRIVLVWHHRTVASNWSGKIKAWVQGAGAFFLLVLAPRSDEVREIISWAVFGVTLASGFEYVKAAVSCACLTSRSHGGGDASGQAGDKEWE